MTNVEKWAEKLEPTAPKLAAFPHALHVADKELRDSAPHLRPARDAFMHAVALARQLFTQRAVPKAAPRVGGCRTLAADYLAPRARMLQLGGAPPICEIAWRPSDGRAALPGSWLAAMVPPWMLQTTELPVVLTSCCNSFSAMRRWSDCHPMHASRET